MSQIVNKIERFFASKLMSNAEIFKKFPIFKTSAFMLILVKRILFRMCNYCVSIHYEYGKKNIRVLKLKSVSFHSSELVLAVSFRTSELMKFY